MLGIGAIVRAEDNDVDVKLIRERAGNNRATVSMCAHPRGARVCVGCVRPRKPHARGIETWSHAAPPPNSRAHNLILCIQWYVGYNNPWEKT